MYIYLHAVMIPLVTRLCTLTEGWGWGGGDLLDLLSVLLFYTSDIAAPLFNLATKSYSALCTRTLFAYVSFPAFRDNVDSTLSLYMYM